MDSLKYRFLPLLWIFAILVFNAAPLAKAESDYSISGNASGSQNQINIDQSSSSNVSQDNSADVNNDIDVAADTGNNSVSDTNGDANITTGDVNADVSTQNEANSSTVDAECCQDTSSTATITGNGAGSTNSVNVDNSDTQNIAVTNNANITNSVSGSANTGNNSVSDTNGDVSIQTGDINAATTINNGPVNYVSVKAGQGQQSLEVEISGNGSQSTNFVSINQGGSQNVSTVNSANVVNNVNWLLNTGGNSVNDTLGSVSINTGDINLDVFISNLVNISEVDLTCPNGETPDNPSDPGDGEDNPPGNNDAGSSSSDSSGGGGGSSSSSGIGGQILGLSDTNSPEAQTLFWFVGLVMIGYGAKIVSDYYAKDNKATPY